MALASMDLFTGLFTIGLTLVGLTTLGFVAHYVRMRFLFQDVPGPSCSSFLWGEEWELYHRPPGSLYSSWHKKYGPVVNFSGALGRQIISIVDPRAISFILVERAYDFPKARGVRAWFDATVGKGILWVEGKAAHERQRRLVAPPLSSQSIRSFIPMLLDTSSKLAAQFYNILDQDDQDEVEIEITNWAGRFALDSVCRAVLAYDFDCLSGRAECLSETLDALTNSEGHVSSFYMRALFWIFPSIISIGSKGRLIRQTKHQFGMVASTIWKDAQAAGDNGDRSLIAHLLKTVEADKVREGISEEELASHLRSIISAGYEPVSSTLAWILYEISVNQNVQDDLRDEVATLRNNTMEGINSLPLLDAAIKETLRLHPPINENHHEAGKTISIPLSSSLPGALDARIVIPKGTLLAIPLNVIHRDPKLWGRDADRFRPCRWSNCHPDAGPGRDRLLLSFSEGPRSCLGKTFAVLELKVLLVTLITQFRFRCEADIEEFQSFVVRPRVKGESASSLPLLVSRV